MSTTVNILCYRSKTLSNGEHPLMVRVCKDGKKKYISIGLSIMPDYWDFEKNQPKKNCPNKDEIQQIIYEKIKEYRERILDYKIINKEFTATSLVKKVSNPVKAKTVDDVFKLYIERLKAANRLRYATMFTTAYNSLIEFNAHLDIFFSEIDISWLKKYETWMLGKGLAMNTLETRFVGLRTIFNFAIEENITKSEYYPFKTYKISKLKQKTAKRSIPKKDILKIINYQGKTDYECLAIDLFTFSYLTAGINFVDISRLKHENIIGNQLSYIRKKTNKRITIPLQTKALEIIEKNEQINNPYLFPILSPFHKTEQQKVNRVHKVISKVNKQLKMIGQELNVPINLTTYVARHSFSTQLKRAGVSTSIISECLGHSSEKITQIYLDSFGNEQINEAMKNLL